YNAAIDVRERYLDRDGSKAKHGCSAFESGKQPIIIRLTHVALRQVAVLCYQDVLFERRHLAIMPELMASIVLFRRLGKHLNNDFWIKESVQDVVFELWFPANDHDVWISV